MKAKANPALKLSTSMFLNAHFDLLEARPIRLSGSEFHVLDMLDEYRSPLRHGSKHLRILLDPSGHFKEAAASHVVLEDDNLSAVEIWLRVLHDKETQRSYTVAVSVLRHLIILADKYIIEDLSPVCTWFEEWFDRWDTIHRGSTPGVNAVRELLYPTWRLNHATAFARVTKFLAYEDSGHVTESYPRDDGTHLHLPPRIIQQLNAAKGRLRNILNQHLLDVTKELFKANCRCKEKAFFGYGKALYKVNVWPPDTEALRNSIHTITDRLAKFHFTAAPGSCRSCAKNYNGIVSNACSYTLSYFDGLCLDCMDMTKTENDNKDYWRHNEQKEWDKECRATHGEPTWYFSFMGRKENEDRFRRRPGQAEKEVRFMAAE
ncbi:MAG: hypothetical protein Q9208_002402 [Pyrenodesmia sp. 3 TL-2023]